MEFLESFSLIGVCSRPPQQMKDMFFLNSDRCVSSVQLFLAGASLCITTSISMYSGGAK